jgi:seryl-tRNA synthetase
VDDSTKIMKIFKKLNNLNIKNYSFDNCYTYTLIERYKEIENTLKYAKNEKDLKLTEVKKILDDINIINDEVRIIEDDLKFYSGKLIDQKISPITLQKYDDGDDLK